MSPYERDPVEDRAAQRHRPRPPMPPTPSSAWTCTFNGLGSSLSCTCTNTSYSLPPNLVTTLDNVVISEATYDYKPLVFDYFMKTLGHGRRSCRHLPLAETISSSRATARSICSSQTTRPARRRPSERLRSDDALRLCCVRRPLRVEAAGGLPQSAVAIAEPADFHLCWQLADARGRGTPPQGTPWDAGRRTRRSSCAS